MMLSKISVVIYSVISNMSYSMCLHIAKDLLVEMYMKQGRALLSMGSTSRGRFLRPRKFTKI